MPDLTGISVIILGQGATAAPQQPLDERARHKLRAIWETLLRTAGATDITYEATVLTTPPDTALPPVTPIPIQPAPSVAAPASTTATAAPSVRPQCSLTLTNDQVGFRPDTADYLDPTTAQATIAAAAQQIAACPGRITLTGTTSSAGTPDGRIKTSTDRAAAVRDTLAMALAINPQDITVVGAGADNPWYINDRDSEGQLVPELAVQNRAVYITVTS